MTPQEQAYIFDEESVHISRNEQEEINAEADNLKVLYRLIPLTQGQWAVVDTADYDWLSQWKWFANYNQCTRSYYAGRNIPREGGGRSRQMVIWMHREILGLPRRSDGRCGDHINHATTDNRRVNLRIATRAENARNHRVCANSPCGFTGVSFFVPANKWRSRITFEGRQIFLGYFYIREEAVEAYRKAIVDLYGEFAPKVYQECVAATEVDLK